jgi:uncharacterized membrane protein YkvA (DUF1232 family)
VAPGVRSALFVRAAERAATLVAGTPRLGRTLAAAAAALKTRGRSLGGVRRDAQGLARMAREVGEGRYRTLPKGSLIAIVAAMLYFLDPLDAIPDFIPVIGFLDDAAVLLWVANRVRHDLDAFLTWEAGQGAVIAVVPVATPAS